MIVKIQLRNQNEVGKLFAVLCSDDNHPPLNKSFDLFTTTGEVLDGLAQDMGGVKRDQGLYLVTLKVADFVGIISDTSRKPYWPMTWAVPVEWIQKIFNAFGRFPAKVQPSKPAERKGDTIPRLSTEGHKEMQALLLRLVAFVRGSTHTRLGPTVDEEAYNLLRDYLKGEVMIDLFLDRYAAITGMDRKDAESFVTDIGRAMAIDTPEPPAEPKPLPLTPGFLSDFHSLISRVDERDEAAIRDWIKGVMHAYSGGEENDIRNLSCWLKDSVEIACPLSQTVRNDQTAMGHFNGLVAYFRRHCLGENE